MKTLLVILLALAAAGCTGCASVPSHEDLRSVTLRLRFSDGICSGTAIGPTVILTASHCFGEGGRLVSVNDRPVQVVRVEHDGADHAVAALRGVAFDRWAEKGARPTQGDRVRFWGNPRGEPDVYREGTVAKVTTTHVLIDAMPCKGDSGAGLFNDRGQLVGMVSAVTKGAVCQFGIAFGGG